MLRVWTPWGYDPNNPPPEGYPVMVIADGQNIFEDETSHQGVSWRAADAAAGLIGSGVLKPFIIVGIDGATASRPTVLLALLNSDQIKHYHQHDC